MAVCRKRHQSPRTEGVVSNLNDSQRGARRHKCAACAYEEGLAEGLRRGAELALEAARRLRDEARNQ